MTLDAIDARHVGERTEKDPITAFFDKIAELSPQLVTFNGNSFDLPVLRYRAVVNSVLAPGFSSRPYFHRYPRTVWATTRRAGSWGNLDVYHHLGVGAARIAKTRTSKSFEALREHIKNKLGDKEFAPTHGFLRELAAVLDDWEETFLDAARTIGTETFRPGLEDATTLWDDCAEIYGQGRKFRIEVAEMLEGWFNDHPELHDMFDRRLQAAWLEHVLSTLRELCEGSIEEPESQHVKTAAVVG